MRRREFIRLLGGATAAWSLGARAQQSKKLPRLCFLTFDPVTLESTRFKPFFKGLSDLGYVDGQTIIIDYLSADGQGERFPALASECLRLKADIIVATTTPAAKAAKAATPSIPIVMHVLGDPVTTGLVASLNRPGENVTGVTSMASGIAAKRLELLKEAVPNISRVLVLSYEVDPIAPPQLKELDLAAATLGAELLVFDIRNAADIQAAFEAGSREGVEGVLTTIESIFATEGKRVVQLALEHGLPGLYPFSPMAAAGGLMAFNAITSSFQARTAIYVDKILKGANPSELPVEQPTTFELIINLKTAKTLGLTVPLSLIVRADELIE